MRKRTPVIFVGIVALAVIAYVLLRAEATNSADRDIDAFFRGFAQQDSLLIEKHFRHLSQSRQAAEEIVGRHSAALTNFTYKKIAPSLDVTLNRTVVPVSWHLNLVFARQADGWYVESFDEFVRSQ